MKLSGDYTFDAPLEEVWRALLDPVVLAATMPGCEKLELVGEQYVGELNVKIGPVQGKFIGKIDLVDVVENESYTIKVDGRGAPGLVNATARVKLARVDAGTKMTYDADATVGGKIASVGQRLVEASAKAIIKQSLESMNELVKARMAAMSAAAAKKQERAEERAAASAASSGESAAEEGSDGEDDDEPPPPPRPKPIDQTKFAAAVAKEVGKDMLPRVAMWAIIALALGGLIWLLLSMQ